MRDIVFGARACYTRHSEIIRTYREDVLDAYLFDGLEEVRHITEGWLENYNTIRPHEALQGLAPRQFALQQP